MVKIPSRKKWRINKTPVVPTGINRWFGRVISLWPKGTVYKSDHKRSFVQSIRQMWLALRPSRRAAAIVFSMIIVGALVIDFVRPYIQSNLYAISDSTELLLVPAIDYYEPLIEQDFLGGDYRYNEGYQPGGDIAGQSASPKFSAVIHDSADDGVTVRDVVNNVSITIKPLFSLGSPLQDSNRIVYPLFGGLEGQKIISLGATGYKEDIILESFVEEQLDFSYQLVLPAGIEARLEENGSLAFYGVDPLLLGDVTASSDSDQALLNEARENGEKNHLLFQAPPPVVLEKGRKRSQANAWYSLENSILTIHTDQLDDAKYPISIDPSIYVETARKLMRGNNETNIDFDIDNELIKKGFTTGARFDQWNNTLNLNEGRWNHGTAVAGGNIYAIGGERTTTTTVSFSTAGSDTWNVPAGVNEITVKMWGAGGGGGAGGQSGGGVGGNGGGGGFSQATLSVTPSETLNIYVGEGGGAGSYPGTSGGGGGGGGHTEIDRSGTRLIIAAGGAGGGGGDNSSTIPGGAGGAGGGTSGVSGGASSNANGGNGGTQVSGGSGGTGGSNSGSSGGLEAAGDGGNGGSGTGAENNGGQADDGDGGTAATNGFAGGGGGGGGYYGGGGGSSSQSGNAGGGGGGGGSGYVSGTSTTLTAGSGSVPGNDSDSNRSGAGDGGSGGGIASAGSDGDDGIIVISYTDTSASVTQAQSPATAQCSDTDNRCTATATISPATAGNHIIAVCSGEGATGWTNVAMSGYTSALTETTNANMGQEIFFKVALGGETSVSCNLNGVGSGIKGYLTVYEYSGLAGSPIDVTASNTGSGTSPTTGTTATTDRPDTLLIAAISSDQPVTQSSWLNSFSEETDQSQADPQDSAQATASRVVSATSTYSSGATASATSNWIGQIVAFKADTTGTGSEVRPDVYWAQLSTTDNSIESPNPGAGTCTEWCTNSAYDLPEERAGAAVVAYNGFLYVVGGEDNSGTRKNTVFIAKLGANGEPSLWHPTDGDQANWDYWFSSSNTLSNATSYGALAAYNNQLYFLGGQTSGSSGGVTTVYRANLDPTGDVDAWTTSGTTVLPSVRHMHSAHVYNDYIYLVGGNSNGTLQNSVHYTKLDSDGSMNSWTATTSFDTARSTWGGNYSVIWGGYLYLAGGCSAVDAQGECTTIALDVQLASINADGSLDVFNTINNVTNQRIGFGLVAWDNALYRIGGCSSQDLTTGECLSVINDEDYAVINTDGDASTVSISEASGSGDCVGAEPFNCDLPPAGDDAGEGGHMLSSVTVINGFLYVIGGCVDYDCNGSTPAGDDTDASGNVAYAAINSDGTLGQPDTCIDSYYGAWCVDSTNRVNGTDGIATAGVTVFNGTIYLVGGVDGSDDIDGIYRNEVNPDGSLAGNWIFQNWSSVGIGAAEEIFYAFAYARANPSAAGTNPGNLYIMGGCGDYSGSGIGCTNADYRGEVYKCNIGTSGAVSSCSTSGQLQIDIDSGTAGDQGIGAHAGTVYANRIYLIAGLDSVVTDRDEVLTAEFDDSNNIVAISGSDWQVESNSLVQPRRRGSGFGYNGYVYGVGGFEDGGGTIIDDIEFAQVDVSDGSIGAFSTSTVTINQRWGLAMAVSNSFAYVIGGCDQGASPGSCSSFEPSVQTFQLYNNNSGGAAGYSASGNQFNDDRFGASSVISNGYIYFAGGCTDADVNCDAVTSDIQYAQLDALGNIGTWNSTTSPLPSGRAWGQLEEAGGSLYWIGGEDAIGDERSDVYYATPLTTAGSAQDVFRSTTYEIESGEFTGTIYTLGLNNDLADNYFTMISGPDDATTNNTPSESAVRVSQDPHGNFATSTSNMDEIQLARAGSGDDWVGSVTVVECLADCDNNGFQLQEVRHVSLPAGTADALQTVTDTLSHDYTSNTVPYGARYGGGMSVNNGTAADYSTDLGVRIYKSNTNQITLERYGAASRVPTAADVEVYIVEWGDAWTVQEANFVDWNAGGDGANASGEYTTQTISSITVDDTWIWKSPGTSEDDGLGDGAFGKVVTLGDGTSPVPATTTTTVAIGSEQSSAEDIRRDTVYVMTHDDLAADYAFVTDNSSSTSETTTIAGANGSESYDNSSTSVRYTEGYRAPLLYATESGTGNSYARSGAWAPRITADTTLTYEKTYSGNNHAAWAIVADFAGISSTPGAGDIASWSSASNGLPADRTQFGAASWNDRLYVVGGLDDSGSETNTVYYSPDLSTGGDITSAWTSDADVPDVARSGNVVVAYANNLYTFGGHDGSNYLLDSQFSQINSDGSVDAWTFTTPLPDAMRQGDGFAANGYMYVVGGRDQDSASCDSNTYIAPISANTTIATGNNPTGVGEWYETNERYSGARFGNAVAHSQGKMYLLGGGCETQDIETFSSIGADTYSVPAGVSSITVKMWGAGGGGGAGGSSGVGGNGGGAGFVEAILSVTPSESLNIYVGEAGGAGTFPGTSGAGGGGGGHSEIDRSGTRLLIAAGGAGGGGGDNSASTAGGAGGAGGGTTGATGGASSNANGGGGGTQASGGSGGTGGTTSGSAGGLEAAGDGGNGNNGSTGGANNGGAADDGDGGTAATGGFAGGGGGGGGYYGGGGGSASQSGDAGGGGGGGGSNYLTGTSQTDTQGSGSTPGNSGDADRNGAGQGGGGGGTSSDGSSGTNGLVIITQGAPVMTLTGANRTQQTTLLTQPQVAKYSRLIDTDSDVFPNAFLLNGIDNSIGARWSVSYRSMHDNTDSEVNPNEDCGTSGTMPVMSSFGQQTQVDEVVLGDVYAYVPLNDSGGDINCARFFYFFVEISAEQTYGYPEDVNRGPTITDLTLYFTSDPNTRLRHGKTFTGGEQQPLDTPPPVP